MAAASVRASTSETEYLNCVNSAMGALEAGRTDVALAQLKVALKWDANDSLAHAVLGVSLLMGGRSQDAAMEFSESASLAPRRAEAVFGQGLTKLSEGRTAAAMELFCKAQSLSPRPEITEAIRYVKMLAGGSYEAASNPASEADKAMDALGAMSRNRYADCVPMWTEQQAADSGPAFGERIGFSMTFVPTRPLAVAGEPLKGKLELPPAARFKGPKVSGTVSLRADLTKVRDVAMVAFMVDNKLAGLTNQSPFQYMWDTTRVANGQHTVRIVGSDSAGCAISEKTTVVQVRNALSSSESAKAAGDGQEDIWDKLWSLMRLRPSVAAVNYNLAVCCRNSGDSEAARAALERVMAVDPGYKDAAHELVAMRHEARGPQTLHRVQTNAKMVALTFDDGPSANTGKLLDVLKENGVNATFFVVGKQAEAHPDLLRRIAQEGHEIENHTYNHRALDLLSTTEIEQEIFRCAAAIRSITGAGSEFVRPPGGRSGKRLEDVANRFGTTTVFWTANCTSREGGKWEKMRDYIIASASPGAIVLMHNTEGVTLRALPSAIDALRAEGYSFATLSELISESSR